VPVGQAPQWFSKHLNLRYNDLDSEKYISQTLSDGRHVSCYGPDLNNFSQLENCFKHYSESGHCDIRTKVTEKNKHQYHSSVGEFTPWESSPEPSDCLFYDGIEKQRVLILRNMLIC